LQFNLKRLSTTQIVDRMSYINAEEKIEAEGAALIRIARAASGSMRDALSLLDQALAYGGGSLLDVDVASMLGSMDRRHINELLQCLIEGDAAALMGQIRSLHELVPDYESVLDDLATVVQQISVFQLAGADALDEDADIESLQQFAGALGDDVVQLYYQIAVTGRRDLGLAPDPRVGFEMTLLRMLAFRPAGSATAGVEIPPRQMERRGPGSGSDAAATDAVAASTVAADDDWSTMIEALNLRGAVGQLAQNCAIGARDEQMIRLDLPGSSESLLTDKLKTSLTEAIRAHLGKQLRVKFKVVDSALDTVASRQVDESAQQLEVAKESIKNDPNVQQLMEMFDATVEADSIRPIDRMDRPAQQGKA
jgi:DNA polymerase-3 subunit gamma/tau